MSGIGTSLADLDKTVKREVPGGWALPAAITAAVVAPQLAPMMAAEAGAATAASAASTAATAATAAEATVATAAAMEGAAAASSVMGSASPFMTSAYQAAVPGLTMTGPGSQAAMLAAQTGEFGLQGLASTAGAGGSPFFSALASAPSISTNQAMALNRAMGGFGQPQGGTSTQTGAFRPGQPVNLADPIASLLAPKRKKERPMISLL